MALIILAVIIMLFAPSAQAHVFKHVVLVIQENRTPDTLFHGLCFNPFGSAASCSITPSTTQYNILTNNWHNKHSATGVTQPLSISLAPAYDLNHSPSAYNEACDLDTATGLCRMNGSAEIACIPVAPATSCPSQPQFRFVDNSGGILNPYLTLVKQYGWANHFHQTNKGPSFPAHLYLFGGTSAPTANDDGLGIFVVDNGLHNKGCESAAGTTVPVVGPHLYTHLYPCFEHVVIPDILKSQLTWKYYAPANAFSIWVAPNAIHHICGATEAPCTGPNWTQHLDAVPADVINDTNNCKLPSMSWVVPGQPYSDHAGNGDGTEGPSWVAAIVNAVGQNTACDGVGYWQDTAVLVVWDDWGGWYDHERPPLNTTVQSDNELGLRVPFIFVSAFTPRGFISNALLDFGAIVRFIEGNFGVTEGALHFADARTRQDLGVFHQLLTARPFTPIKAPLSASFFLNDPAPTAAPDTE